MSLLRIVVSIAALLFVTGCSSTTSSVSDSSAAENTVASAAGGDDGVVCKRVQVTGTRLTEKVCTTAAQREARARAARDAQAQVGIRAQQVGGPSGG